MEYAERVEIAKVGYQAYGDTAEWKNYRGDPMPHWDDLGDRIQTCWIMAASAVRNHVLTPPSQRG
jgi:hypothetical protein